MCFNVEDYVNRKLPIQCIAHRGFSGRYPQSTTLAFEKAIEVGADLVEFDVQLTGDDKLIVFHDLNLMRFCPNGQNMWIKNMTLSEIASLDIGMGQTIMSYEEALELLAGRTGFNIHIKDEVICERVIRLARQAGIMENTCFLIEWKDSIKRIQRLYSDAWICSLYNRATDDMIEVNSKLGIKIIMPTINAFADGAAERIISQAREKGMVLHVSYTDYYSHFIWLKRLGVDGIITNYPDQMLRCFRGDVEKDFCGGEKILEHESVIED